MQTLYIFLAITQLQISECDIFQEHDWMSSFVSPGHLQGGDSHRPCMSVIVHVNQNQYSIT